MFSTQWFILLNHWCKLLLYFRMVFFSQNMWNRKSFITLSPLSLVLRLGHTCKLMRWLLVQPWPKSLFFYLVDSNYTFSFFGKMKHPTTATEPHDIGCVHRALSKRIFSNFITILFQFFVSSSGKWLALHHWWIHINIAFGTFKLHATLINIM